jgi:hypothetical protein
MMHCELRSRFSRFGCVATHPKRWDTRLSGYRDAEFTDAGESR